MMIGQKLTCEPCLKRDLQTQFQCFLFSKSAFALKVVHIIKSSKMFFHFKKCLLMVSVVCRRWNVIN